MIICEYGCGKEAIHQFKSSKKWCCSINVNTCEGKRKKDSSNKKGKKPNWKNGHPKGMLGKSPWNKGLKNDARCARPELKGKKFGAAITGHTEQTKSKLRNIALQRYADGWDNKAGRCKKYKYSSVIAGEITVDGTWR